MGEVEPVQRAAPIRVVVRGALAAQIRRPHRHPPRIHGGRIPRRQNPIHPAEEQSAGVAGPADAGFAGRGVRNRPQPRHPRRPGRGHPHDQGGAAQHQHVAIAVGAGHQLFAQGVDCPDTEHGVADAARRRAGRRDRGHSFDRRAVVGARLPAPAGAVEQRQRGVGGGEIRPPPPRPARDWLPPSPASSRPPRGRRPPSSARIRRPPRSAATRRRGPKGPGRGGRRRAVRGSAACPPRPPRSATAPSRTPPTATASGRANW
ncbi:hypothetical protein C1Y40_05729 [Mycobacterium talmoniae]|uniref:Uncharacterized protein n=1 Tax=Mycobacterium talmoniae TaxID=1858794 RepID=A0A2S8BBT4_9MYCO|nr:hypothetical protein C1Y40_05729 [Mycobacterium talmoniae]